tara:strand:+ start:19163 stop:20245 length:1083 start_codon:yes stop_codon:yes gene_type:complete
LGIVSICSAIYLGALFDKLGQRKCFFYSALVIIGASVILIMTNAMIVLLLSFAILKISALGITIFAAAAIGQTKEVKFKKFFWLSVWGFLGGALGPPATGYFYDALGSETSASFFAIVGACVLILSFFFEDRKELTRNSMGPIAVHKSSAKLLAIPGILTPILVVYLQGNYEVLVKLPGMELFGQIISEKRNVLDLKVEPLEFYLQKIYVIVSYLLALIFGFFASLSMLRRWSHHRFLVIGISCLCLTTVIANLLSSYGLVVSIMAGMFFGIALVLYILSYSIPSQCVGPEHQGKLMGLRAFCISLVGATSLKFVVWTYDLDGILESDANLTTALSCVVFLIGTIYLARRIGFFPEKQSS